MTFIELLKEEGWYLSQEGVEILGYTEDSTDVKEAVKKILDYDLREIGAPAFPEEYCKSGSRSETLTVPVCVQLQKVRNISAPKVNEESRAAPRMLKLIFTDGVLSYQGVEVEYISGLSVNTPPGTKIQIKPGSINAAHNILFLEPGNIKVLGGHVTHMVEKWELNRRLAKHTRGGGENSPPLWIPFGQPLEGVGPHDRSFKSLQEGPKADNVEFETQRKGAIAEAQKLSGVKKVFGGGTKPMLDANVQKIVDAGFTEEQAENILKVTRNNADRALKILQKKEITTENKKEKNKQVPENKGGRKGRSKDGVEGGVTPIKPSGKVSLFDFLEDKLPAIPEPEKPVKHPESHTHHREENKRGRGGGGGRGGYSRGGGAGARQGNYHNNYNKHENTFNNNSSLPGYQQHTNDATVKRDDRQPHSHPHTNIQPEKAPRFQKKYENDIRRQHQQHNINIQQHQHQQENSMQQTYQGGYNNAQQQNYYNSERRTNVDNNHSNNSGSSRTFYGQQPIDNLTEATAALNIQQQQSNQTRVYNNSRPAGMNQPPNNQQQMYPTNTNYNYPAKPPMYNNQNMYSNENTYKCNNQYINSSKQNMQQQQQMLPNGQQQMHQSFYAPYPDNQMKMQQESMRQSEMMDPFRQNPMQDQRNNFNNRGNGFYQNNKMMTYQNPNINDQPRKMVNEVGEINWNIGDRCLAKYWEDNGFYDAEITGVSARTVVVRFLAYGNHEEVLKSDCLPPSTPVQTLHNYNPNPNAMMREQSRPARFHQPMYVPPAQRKA